MRLTDADQVWCPVQESPDFLTLLRQGQRPPSKQEDFLRLQADLLERLVAESSEGEVAHANLRLDRDLPQEALNFLPSDLLTNPRTPKLLLLNPAVEGSPLHQWKVAWSHLRNPPLLPQPEARALAEQLSLEAYLSRLL